VWIKDGIERVRAWGGNLVWKDFRWMILDRNLRSSAHLILSNTDLDNS